MNTHLLLCNKKTFLTKTAPPPKKNSTFKMENTRTTKNAFIYTYTHAYKHKKLISMFTEYTNPEVSYCCVHSLYHQCILDNISDHILDFYHCLYFVLQMEIEKITNKKEII